MSAEGEVLLQLLLQALLEVAGGHELAVLAEERGIVDGEEHAHRGLVDGDGREGLRILEVGHGVADLEAVESHHRADVAAAGAVHVALAEAFEHHQLLDLLLLDHVVALAEADHLAGLEFAAGDASHCDTADVRRILERGNEHLRGAFLHLGRRDLLEDGVQKGSDVIAVLLVVHVHPALLGGAVDGLEIELLVGGVEVEHEFENLVLDFFRTAVGLVHLVDHHDGFLAHLEGLLEDETGLGHAAFERVHEKQHAVRHVEDALHLSSEIAVAGGVYDVDLDVLVGDGHVLGEDGDSALALEVVVVEDELSEVFGLADEVRLVYHPVHERGLAVVYVGDDRYVPDILHILH